MTQAYPVHPPSPPAPLCGPFAFQEIAMLTQILPHRPTDGRCRASARNLRTHAELLRDGAEVPVLTTGQRIVLLRDAEAAERQANRRMRALRAQCPGSNGNRQTPQSTDRSCPAKLQHSAPMPAY